MSIPYRLLTLATLLAAAPLLAQASDKACLLEGSFSMMGQKIVIKDCMQNNGMPQAQFVQNCQGASQAAASMGGAPAKITYLAACPTPARGTCDKLFGGPLSGHYYLQDAQALKDTEAGCKAGGGTWKKS
jgi:hypothetical protein